MPGSIHDLTRKLVAAIDPQGNVREMGAVVEVVSALEEANVTAEELRATRIGKYVNLVRRKVGDKGLAKRMKKLVKQWQNLLQSPTVPNGPAMLPPSRAAVNGVAGVLRKGSTSPAPLSPVESQHPSPQPASISPQAIGLSSAPVPAASVDAGRLATPPSTSRQTDPTAQRMKILQRLSKVKTQPPLPHTPTITSTQTRPSQPHAPSLSTAIANDHSHTTDTASLRHHAPPVPVAGSAEPSGAGNPSPSLPLSFPLMNSHLQRPDGSEVLELLVRVPRHLITRVPSEHCDKQPEEICPAVKQPKRPHPLVVSVLLHQLPTQPVRTAVPTGHSLSATLEGDMSRERGVTLPRSHVMPEGAIAGVDGCRGNNGLWYRWTEAIPGEEFSVTVLPYVYIDGLQPMEDPV